MTECKEIAYSIWRARSSLEGNGLNVTSPIQTRDDALFVARNYMPSETQTIINNVAEHLWAIKNAPYVLIQQEH